MFVLEATNLHKRYRLPHKTVDVLNGADLSVQAGERVAIVGRSGAIFDFALVMVIGITFGTFATLFIATPVMTAWYRGRRPGFNAAKHKIG